MKSDSAIDLIIFLFLLEDVSATEIGEPLLVPH